MGIHTCAMLMHDVVIWLGIWHRLDNGTLAGGAEKNSKREADSKKFTREAQAVKR